MPVEEVGTVSKKRFYKTVMIVALISLLVGLAAGYAFKTDRCNKLIKQIKTKYQDFN